jgi:protease IV
MLETGAFISLLTSPHYLFFMQLNRTIALLLLIVCLVAAALGVQRRQEQEAFNLKNFESSRNRLELVNLDGVIAGGTRATSTNAIGVRNRLLDLEDDEEVKGILLVINTPGGTVGASKEVYEAVKKVRAAKPIVVSMLDQATSGGYYVASAATKIYANPGTLTGSIGVILSGFNLKELLNRVGVESQTIKTGPFKDIFSPYRQITEPEKALLQTLLQDTYQEFISDVAKGRKMDLEVVRKLADGRIYTGKQAKENKLVDALGTYEEALADLRKLVREKFKLSADEKLPIKVNSGTFGQIFSDLLGSSSTNPSNSAIARILEKLMKTTPAGMPETSPPVLLLPSWFE